MTPTTADKVKEIAVKSLSYFLRHDYFDHDEAFDNWAASEEGSRLVGELGEDWVSIKKELPGYGRKVLIYKTYHKAIQIASREATDNHGEHWSCDYEHYVTHWQLLPKAPQNG